MTQEPTCDRCSAVKLDVLLGRYVNHLYCRLYTTARNLMSENRRTVERYLDGFRRTDRAQILSCLTDERRTVNVEELRMSDIPEEPRKQASVESLKSLERRRFELNARANDAFDYECWDSLEIWQAGLAAVNLAIERRQGGSKS